MASNRNDGDVGRERKKARVTMTDASSQSAVILATSGTKWDWPTTTVSSTGVQTRPRNNPSPSCASDSVSLSGSDTCGSQKASPISTPVVVSSLRVVLPKALCRDTDSPSAGVASALNTPPVIGNLHGDIRPFLIRPSALVVDEQNNNHDGTNAIGISSSAAGTSGTASTIGVVAPWHMQDFGDGLAFDASLSGLSDLAAPGCVNDMMEFVKRQSSHPGIMNGDNYTFQYILMAPTSAAIKLHEEPLTYLNQGQSYEIKCKKLGMEGMIPGRLFRAVIRVTFHDRRQKFQEKELLNQWKQMHMGNKIIDADIPLSYNVFNVKTDPMGNSIDFLWDPTKNTSIFLKVNCISTEFTLRKHGGEKGVPFRLQIDTYMYGDDVEPRQLHSSYAQVKVFKTKGADRKNKTDREKAERHADKEKYQPSYDYTILTETFPVDTYDEYDRQQQQSQPNPDDIIMAEQVVITPKAMIAPLNNSGMGSINPAKTTGAAAYNAGDAEAGMSSNAMPRSPSPISEDRPRSAFEELAVDATPAETNEWLRRHRFFNYLKTFSNFSGSDLLRLSREDLIQICGSTADGIRLFNALQSKKVQPKLTLYMCVPGAPAYHAVFLIALTLHELVRKVCELIQVQPSQVFDVYCQGPDGINVHMNDDVVQNLPDRSRYVIDAMKCGDEQAERYRILLKAATET